MNIANITEFNQRQALYMLCGDHIGSGAGRHVYRNKMDDKTVIKIEEGSCSFQNIMEWQVWEAVKDTEFAKWFAPCIAISPAGSVLVQRRTVPAANYPEQIPVFLTDTKLTNYGILFEDDRAGLEADKPGQFVCHDYGTCLLLTKGLSKRMWNANWWNL